MERYNKIQFCENCFKNKKIYNATPHDIANNATRSINVNCYGYMISTYVSNDKLEECPWCHYKPLKETRLVSDEFRKIQKFCNDPDFLVAMIELKEKDIIEFNLKLSQMQPTKPQQEQNSSYTDNKPKCPTCGSPNVKKISGTKRWFGTGLFGLASSNIGKTMVCGNCGYKW